MNKKTPLIVGRPSVGAWISLPCVQSADAMLSCGFDWVVVDLEHGSLSISNTIDVIIAAERRGVVPFARLPNADPYLARRLLDGGLAGLVVPGVESSRDFSEFSQHCLYPPAGRRGVGLSRANVWGDKFQDYLSDSSPVLIAQIETVKGMRAVRDITSLTFLDGVFIGPYDLSLSLGESGDFTSPAFSAAWREILEACKVGGVPAGIHQVEPDPIELSARFEEGFDFVAYGTDVIAMRSAFKDFRDRVPN